MMSTKTNSNHNDNRIKVKSVAKGTPNSGKKSQSKITVTAEGIYANGRLMHTLTSLVGNVVQVVVTEGITYEGVFQTFSPKLEVVLSSVNEVVDGAAGDPCSISSLINSLSAKKPLTDQMVFQMEKIVSVDMPDVDLEFASKDGFLTDTDISGLKKTSETKEFMPWQDDSELTPLNVRGGSLELGLEAQNGHANSGWTAEQMFKTNENLGVQSTFDGLEGKYTTRLNKNDPKFEERERLAETLAAEIEGKGRIGPDEGNDGDELRTEEERWGSVIRTTRPKVQRSESDTNWRQQNKTSQQKAAVRNQPPKERQFQQQQQQSPTTPQSRAPQPLERRLSNSSTSKPRDVPQVSQHPLPGTSYAKVTSSVSHETLAQRSVEVSKKAEEVKKTEPVKATVNISRNASEEAPKGDVTPVKKEESSPSSTPSKEVDKDLVLKTSKLNPNAKEFTLNPSAKPFTPKSIPSPQPPLIGAHPGNLPHAMNQVAFQPHHQPHQQQHPQQQPLVMYPPKIPGQVVVGHHPVIGPNGQPLQFLPGQQVVLNSISNHNQNYNTNYNQGGQPPRKPHHGNRDSRQMGGHQRHDNSFNQHGMQGSSHPLHGAPIQPLQYAHHHHQGPPSGPGQQVPSNGQSPMFSPMYLPGFSPRMFQPQMMAGYDGPQYFMPMSMVQSPLQQQVQPNNGPHSTPSTPQSQTPSTPGLHGGPSTPGPSGHAVVPQTPSPQQQQPGVMYQGQAMHGFNQPIMVMPAPPHSHPGALGPNPHLQQGQVINTTLGMMQTNNSNLTGSVASIPQHYNQNQPPPTSQRPI